MTRRVFYIALGATVGVLAFRKASQAAQRLTPSGVGQGMSAAVGVHPATSHLLQHLTLTSCLRGSIGGKRPQ